MGKKKRGHPDIEEIIGRPWCYYCERDFDDLKILINHQKAKHFKCERCGRRLNTAGGLSVHMTQVHKETLDKIDNALASRDHLDVEIFGMEGIPEDAVASHKQRVVTQFAQAEAERRAVTGNPAPGSAAGNAAKKPKFEPPSEMKQRLAEHKAKVAAEQAAQSAGPTGAEAPPMDGQNPGFGQAPGFNAPYPQQYGAPPGGAPFGSFPQPYGQPAPGFQPPPQHFPGGPAPPYGQQSFSPPAQYPPASGAYAPPTPFQPGPNQPPYQSGSPAPQPFPSFSPPAPNRIQTPPQGMSQPPRPSSLPTAPGLPQRPAFAAPPVNAFQMQQMHQGQMGAPPSYSYGEQQPGAMNGNPHAHPGMVGAGGPPPQDKSSMPPSAAAFSNGAGATPVPQGLSAGAAPEGAAPSEKKSKRDKGNDVKMVYSDNEVSPEEKMAKLPRYAFTPEKKEETVLGNATTAAVTGAVEGGTEEVAVAA